MIRAEPDWLAHGFSYLHGYRAGYADAGNQADLTARRIMAQQETTEARQSLAKSAVDFLSVPRVKARQAPVSTAQTKVPTLEQFMEGLARSGFIHPQQQELAA